MKRKVFACITRERAGHTEVLTFTHRDSPEAGVQVPGGTVGPDEEPEAALWREVSEETGLRPNQLQLVGLVAIQPHPEWGTLEHLYHLTAAEGLPDDWTHVVHGHGEDTGMVFEYRWLTLETPLTEWRSRVPPWLFTEEGT
ncbi:MAG: NUDIX domain-containing protein [Anaerolineales bacterium]